MARQPDTVMTNTVKWIPRHYYDWKTNQKQSLETNKVYLLIYLSRDRDHTTYFQHDFIIIQEFLNGYKDLTNQEKVGGAFAIRYVKDKTDEITWLTFITTDNREYIVESLPTEWFQATSYFPTYCYREMSDNTITCLELKTGKKVIANLTISGLNDLRLTDNQTLQIIRRHDCTDTEQAIEEYWQDACVSFYTAPANNPSSLTLEAANIPSPRFTRTALLEVTDTNYALLTESISYECRLSYEKYFYDLTKGTKLSTIEKYDNDCDLESASGQAEELKIRQAKQADHNQAEKPALSCQTTAGNRAELLFDPLTSWGQRIIGCWSDN